MIFLHLILLVGLLWLFARWGRRLRPVMDGYYLGQPILESTAWRARITWAVGDITGRPLARFRAHIVPAEGVNYIEILYLFRWPAGRSVARLDGRGAIHWNEIAVEGNDPERTAEKLLAQAGLRMHKQGII